MMDQIQNWYFFAITWLIFTGLVTYRKLCHLCPMTLTVQRPYMVIQEKFVTYFRGTDDPRPYMVDYGYYRELLSHTRTCKA